jgi:hypothetical protein
MKRQLGDDDLDTLLTAVRQATETNPPAGLSARIRATAAAREDGWFGRLVVAVGAMLAFFLIAALSPALLLAPTALAVVVTAAWPMVPAAAVLWVVTRTA